MFRSFKAQSLKSGRTQSRSALVGNTAYIPYPTVSGGTLTSDATYYYRTFTANGTLLITGGPVSCDIAVIGGGGGGGAGGSGITPGGSGSSFNSVLSAAAATNSLYARGGWAQTSVQTDKNGEAGSSALGTVYGGGGGAGGTAYGGGSTSAGLGGAGGGGNGGSASSPTPFAGTANTGGAGGGAASAITSYWGGSGGWGGQVQSALMQSLNASYTVTIGAGGTGDQVSSYAGQPKGGNGGSGVVVVRYLRASVGG